MAFVVSHWTGLLASQLLIPKMSPPFKAEVAEWQTRGIQNPVSFTGCVGSTPTFGTLRRRYHGLANVLRTPAFPGFSHFWRRTFGSTSRIQGIRSRCQGFSPVLRFLGQWMGQRNHPCRLPSSSHALDEAFAARQGVTRRRGDAKKI